MALRERIRANFDRAAAGYEFFEQRSGFFGSLARRLAGLLPIVPGAAVLDVGCGSGASLGVLDEAVGVDGRVVGLDVSLGMLKEARRRGFGGRVVLADACTYGCAFRSAFDVVCYNAVLFMLADAAASLRCAAEVLRPGGTVLISSLEGVTVSSARCPISDVLADRGHAPGRHAVSPWPVVAGVLEQSFEAPSVCSHTIRLTPGDFLAFYGLEPMSAGLLPRVSYPERQIVLRELAREWEEDGVLLEQIWTLAKARKLN